MATADPETLARATLLVVEKMGLSFAVRAAPSMEFREWTELEDGTRGASIVRAPAVRIGDSVVIRVEPEYYRVYNAASPYHGLSQQGVCKTTQARTAIRMAVMAAVHEHFTALFDEHFSGTPDDDW